MDLRKLDALVAEHVMGLEVSVGGRPVYEGYGSIGEEEVYIARSSPTDDYLEVEEYSRSIRWAWQVLEKMLTSPERDRFAFEVSLASGQWNEEAPEQNVLDLLEWLQDPEQVCRVALKAKWVEVAQE